eukprot:m.31127 g.31127  ORF g.31127 m.31127 type:complete len:122 (-) comp12036_c0_seq1:135-500(-)
MDTATFVDGMQERLEETGAKGRIVANIRAELLQAVTEEQPKPPSLNGDNVIINELIREYLAYNNYKQTEDVLVAESGQPQERLHREFVTAELNLDDTTPSRQLPLLYGIINLLKAGPPTDP